MLLLLIALVVSQTTPPRPVADGVIVGRAVCKGRTFLLTDRRVLTRLTAAGEVASVDHVSGLRADDRPWGLACLNDASLWTLAAPRALARLAADGRVLERVALPLPRVALYGVGDRLLFQAFPLVSDESALQTAPARQPTATRPWPGLTSRASPSREQEIARNLAACGVGDGRLTPCWFVDAAQLSVADGARAQVVDVRAALGAADPEAPLHDAAIAGDSLWVVGAGRQPPSLQRAGVRALHRTRADAPWSGVDIAPPVRVIVSATADLCVLLRVDGSIVEVREQVRQR